LSKEVGFAVGTLTFSKPPSPLRLKVQPAPKTKTSKLFHPLSVNQFGSNISGTAYLTFDPTLAL
jgi:hypothetical protein